MQRSACGSPRLLSSFFLVSFSLSFIFLISPLYPPPPPYLSVGILSPAGGRSVSEDFLNCLTPWKQALKTTLSHTNACLCTANVNRDTPKCILACTQKGLCAQGDKACLHTHTHTLTFAVCLQQLQQSDFCNPSPRGNIF